MPEDYVPLVSRQDIERIVHRDFAAKDELTVMALLHEYGSEAWHPERERVQIAALKLSQGRLDILREQVTAAKMDYRDVIAPAEYPGFWKLGFVGTDALSPAELAKLQADDWAQYQAWFRR